MEIVVRSCAEKEQIRLETWGESCTLTEVRLAELEGNTSVWTSGEQWLMSRQRKGREGETQGWCSSVPMSILCALNLAPTNANFQEDVGMVEDINSLVTPQGGSLSWAQIHPPTF